MSPGRMEINYKPVRHNKRRAGRYAKCECTATGETIYYIDREGWEGHIPDQMQLFLMGIYTAWTVDDNEAEMVIAFDLFPVVPSREIAMISIGWPLKGSNEPTNHEIMYLEMSDEPPEPEE